MHFSDKVKCFLSRFIDCEFKSSHVGLSFTPQFGAEDPAPPDQRPVSRLYETVGGLSAKHENTIIGVDGARHWVIRTSSGIFTLPENVATAILQPTLPQKGTQ